jgi:hypothetical protein
MKRVHVRRLLRAGSILLGIELLAASLSALQAQETAISGTVTIDSSASSRLPTAPLLVITASKFDDRKKPPIIVKRIPNVEFPYAYTLTDDDITLVGSTFDGNLYVTAHIETQNATKGTLEGRAERNPVTVGSKGANIVIALHSEGRPGPGRSARRGVRR